MNNASSAGLVRRGAQREAGWAGGNSEFRIPNSKKVSSKEKDSSLEVYLKLCTILLLTIAMILLATPNR